MQHPKASEMALGIHVWQLNPTQGAYLDLRNNSNARLENKRSHLEWRSLLLKVKTSSRNHVSK